MLDHILPQLAYQHSNIGRSISTCLMNSPRTICNGETPTFVGLLLTMADKSHHIATLDRTLAKESSRWNTRWYSSKDLNLSAEKHAIALEFFNVYFPAGTFPIFDGYVMYNDHHIRLVRRIYGERAYQPTPHPISRPWIADYPERQNLTGSRRFLAPRAVHPGTHAAVTWEGVNDRTIVSPRRIWGRRADRRGFQ